MKTKHRESTDNTPIKIYVNRIENKITFRIKEGYYLELLTSETMKLLGSIKSKRTKNKIGGNVPHLEITEVELNNSNIVDNNYQHNSRFWYTFVRKRRSFGQVLDILPKNSIF